MAVVSFSSELQKVTGAAETRVSARVFKDIVTELANRYPGLEEDRLLDMAISIDGQIIHTPFLEIVAADSELHFLHRIEGG